MCGRYSLFTNADSAVIEQILRELTAQNLNFRAGEIFPTDEVPVLTEEDGRIKPTLMSWGYPSPTGKGMLINARAETAESKRIFCAGLYHWRCAVPTTGFYEWSHEGKKQKHLFRLSDSPSLFLAGFWDVFDDARRFVVLTTEANESMRAVHNRMPVVLAENEAGNWILDGGLAEEYLRRIPPLLEKTAV